VLLIIRNHTAIEVKATRKITPQDLKSLQALQQEKVFKQFILVSEDAIAKKHDNILCLHWKEFMAKLWADELNLN
jgi:hypothetical protein